MDEEPGVGLSPKAGLILLAAIIWGIAGGFFGVVYVAFIRHLEQAGTAEWQIPLAAAVTGAVVATFYSAMRVAVVGALAGAITSLVYLNIASAPLPAWKLMALSGLAGLVLGFPVSTLFERRRGALVVAAAGFTTGALAGTCGALLMRLAPSWAGTGVLIFMMVPLTGILFTLLTLLFGYRMKAVIPQWLSICMVCAAMASVVGVSLWVLAASFRLGVDPELQAAVKAMFDRIPEAVLGGVLGGAVGGALLEVLHLPRIYRL